MKPPQKNTILVAYLEITNGGDISHGLLQHTGLADEANLKSLIKERQALSQTGSPQWRGFPMEKNWMFFDWFGIELEDSMSVCSVAPPKIIFAYLDRVGKTSFDFAVLNTSTKMELERREDIKNHIQSREANEEARFPKHYDVFLSHSSLDKQLAEEIYNSLTLKGLKVFMDSEDITAGMKWEDTIRNSLKSSKAGILLLTKNSVNSSWVMAEAGVMWALDLSIFPLCQNIDVQNLPSLITGSQVRDIKTPEALEAVYQGKRIKICEFNEY